MCAFVDVTAGVVRGEVPDPDVAGEALSTLRRRVDELRAAIATADARIAELERQVGLHATTGEFAPDSRAAIGGDPRDHFIAQVAQQRTFADIGGLYGTVSEKLSVARNNGATELTMIDISPAGGNLWQLFAERMRALGIDDYRSISADVIGLGAQADHPLFDVVHCTGVLYHMPDPLRLLVSLRALTGQYLVLGSAITSASIATDAGTLRLPSAGAIFVPGLRGVERSILDAYWRPFVGDSALGLTADVAQWDVTDYAPWWWLPTIGCFIAMCEAAGFTFIDGATYWNRNAYVALLERR